MRAILSKSLPEEVVLQADRQTLSALGQHLHINESNWYNVFSTAATPRRMIIFTTFRVYGNDAEILKITSNFWCVLCLLCILQSVLAGIATGMQVLAAYGWHQSACLGACGG